MNLAAAHSAYVYGLDPIHPAFKQAVSRWFNFSDSCVPKILFEKSSVGNVHKSPLKFDLFFPPGIAVSITFATFIDLVLRNSVGIE